MNPVSLRTHATPHTLLACRGTAVPRYYGFVPITLRPSRETRLEMRALTEACSDPEEARTAEDAVMLLRRYEEEKMERLPQPVSFCRVVRGARGVPALRLDLLGSSGSIAEALLLHAALVTLREHGYHDLVFRINSIGDRESFGRFSRELGIFYRKRAGELHASCRDALRVSPFPLLACAHGACRAARESAPRPLGFLSESARAHFKEVLEYLEALRIPYELHERLVGAVGVASHTVFEIRGESGALLGTGYRYNHLARRVGARHDIPALGALLYLPPAAFTPIRRIIDRSPQVFFVQLGGAARRKSLPVIEMLRRAHIPLAQSLGSEKLAVQLTHADALKVPFLVIMGHKEALEDSALVRDRERSFQEALPLAAVPAFLARLLA